MDSGERRLVATMPLHAITSAYGEEGLRARFAAEIEAWPQADQLRLNQALALAGRLHAADRREQEPYVNHLLRVAIRIMSHYGVRDGDVVCAGLLHDAVEDHAAELAPDGTRAAALAALAEEFGPRVAALVAAVTNPEYAPGRDADEQYREHVAESLRRDPWARVIKASDFTDNGVGLIHTTGPRLHRLAGKYAPLVPVLQELIALPDTPLGTPARQRILTQLGQAADRFAAILERHETPDAVRPDAVEARFHCGSSDTHAQRKSGILTTAIAGTGKNGEMPELPEVETARRLIADEALGRRITDVDDSDTFVCRPHSPGELRAALTGRTLTAARRRGKTMWCETSEDGPDLGIHLGMGGRIVVTSGDGHAAEGGGPRRRDAQPHKPEWDRFTLGFADGGSLALFDKRRLGRVRLNPGIDALGPDAAEVTPADFRSLITRGSVAVKARLLDQSRIAGVGNLLADEILWQARVHPAARTDTLGPADAERLYRALESALGSAIARGGVHTGDVIAARYPGGSCPRCGAEMRHGTVGGRSTWWCSREQVPTTVR